ncbi:MAG: RDD family protein [Bacillota bacterium]|nr:RDD family protein [Bacillota bacterium]
MNSIISSDVKYCKISKRIMAYIIDMIVLTAIFLIEAMIAVKFKHLVSYNKYKFILDLLGLLNAIIYFSVFESSSKQGSVGKMAMSIIVHDANGNRLSLRKAILRNIIKFFGSIIWIISGINKMTYISYAGYCFAFFTPGNQALHDKIAGSFVIDK